MKQFAPAESAPAIIFDCDGVLIDSEIVVCRLVSEELTSRGYAISVADVISRYSGIPEGEMVADIERDWGQAIPVDYFYRMKAQVLKAYETELRPIQGVAETVAGLSVPVCVASSSAPAKLRLGLRATGLYHLLRDNLVSGVAVTRGKPAPDIFLYAAGWMRADVASCVVVEDSVPGVRAAHAAGMRVVGFVGGSHCPPSHGDRLLASGADAIIEDIRDLRRYVPEAFASEPAVP